MILNIISILAFSSDHMYVWKHFAFSITILQLLTKYITYNSFFGEKFSIYKSILSAETVLLLSFWFGYSFSLVCVCVHFFSCCKRSVFNSIPKKGNAKECSNYHITALISHASKVMLKILQAGFSSTWTENFQMYKLDLEKAGAPEIKLPTSVESKEKQRNSRKTSTSAPSTSL